MFISQLHHHYSSEFTLINDSGYYSWRINYWCLQIQVYISLSLFICSVFFSLSLLFSQLILLTIASFVYCLVSLPIFPSLPCFLLFVFFFLLPLFPIFFYFYYLFCIILYCSFFLLLPFSIDICFMFIYRVRLPTIDDCRVP